MRIAKPLMIMALWPSPVLAQLGREMGPATIVVSASGSVETAPDMATLAITLRGEGKTPDAATAALAARGKAVIAGLRSLDPNIEVRTGSVSIREAYTGACNRGGFVTTMADFEAMADSLEAVADEIALSPAAKPAGSDCIVVGRIAEIETAVVMRSVKDAGTAVGLAGRLGATHARTRDFGLRDDSDASNRAIAKAMANARAKAQVIASATGARLGGIISVDDGSERAAGFEPPAFAMQAPMELIPPPVVVAVSPRPVETGARLTVTFAIEPLRAASIQ